MDPSETSREKNPGTESSIDYNRPADNPSGRSLEELLNEVDAETLDQRRHERSTSDPRDMKRCPACGSVKLHQKTGGPCGTRKPGDYRCDGCNHHFDEPVVDDDTADGTADVVTDGGETVRPVNDSPPHIPDAEIYSTHRPGEWIAITDAVYADVVTGSWHEDYRMSFVALPTGRLWVHITTAWERYEDTPPSDYAVTDGGHPPGHSPDPSAADRSSAAEYYVVDEARPAVVDGPLPMARAKSLANEHGPDHVVASRDAVRLLESAGDTTVRWETDEDVDVVTDGGIAPCPRCDTDLLVQQSVTKDEDWWCHGCDRHFSSDDPPGGVTIRTDGGQPAGPDEVELRIRTTRATIAGLIPVFGVGVRADQDGGALKRRADQVVSQIYDELEAEYPEADRRKDLLEGVLHTNQHGGSCVPLEVSIVDVDEDADGGFEEVR